MSPTNISEQGGSYPGASSAAATHNTTTGAIARAAAESNDARPECLRVLVVDDAPDVTEMIATLIRFAGYEVTTALSATEAFDAARGDHYDAVVSDIGMPGMNGYQLAEALRALPEYARTPLVAVTGFTMYDDRERARLSGFDDFLSKPINPSDLLDILKRLCG
jgi:CheY-like chemotaxis protein